MSVSGSFSKSTLRPSRVAKVVSPATWALAVFGSSRMRVRLVTDLPEPDSPTNAVVLPG